MSTSTGWAVFTGVVLVLYLWNRQREKRKVGVSPVLFVGRPAPRARARGFRKGIAAVAVAWGVWLLWYLFVMKCNGGC